MYHCQADIGHRNLSTWACLRPTEVRRYHDRVISRIERLFHKLGQSILDGRPQTVEAVTRAVTAGRCFLTTFRNGAPCWRLNERMLHGKRLIPNYDAFTVDSLALARSGKGLTSPSFAALMSDGVLRRQRRRTSRCNYRTYDTCVLIQVSSGSILRW